MRQPSIFEQSFASHPRATNWSNKNSLKPRQVFRSSGNKFIFDCDICSHEFESQLNSIVKGSWCSFCANKQLCHNNCDLCYNKSFACHPRADFWSDQNNVSTRQVFLNSNTKFWFNCDKCPHEFKSPLYSITSGFWCPFCSNKDLCEEEKCKLCFEKSFASSNRAKHWSPKNILQPRRVFLNSNKKFMFICENNHEFINILGNITNNQWCPKCKNRTENKLYDWLLLEYKEVGFQPKFAWCKNKKKNHLPFDFQIEKFKIL